MRWIFFCLVILNLAFLTVYWGSVETTTDNKPVVTAAAGQRLTLISEAAVTLPRVDKQQTTTDVQRCFLLGPYADRVDANYARARAESLGVNGDTHATELPTQQPREFWVFVPPRANREEARKVLRELQQRKIDSYIINAGELADGISLGLFRQQESAQQVVDKVNSYNIPAQIQIKNEVRQEFWLEVPARADFGPRLRERILAEDQNVEWEMTNCR